MPTGAENNNKILISPAKGTVNGSLPGYKSLGNTSLFQFNTMGGGETLCSLFYPSTYNSSWIQILQFSLRSFFVVFWLFSFVLFFAF